MDDQHLVTKFNKLFSPGTPRFGLDKIKWIKNQWEPDTMKAYIFKLASEDLGCDLYGKVIFRSRMYSAVDHPKDIEHQVLKMIQLKVRPLAQHLFPQMLYSSPISIYNRSLCPLPLYDYRHLNRDEIYEDCGLIITPSYGPTLHEVISTGLLEVEDYRYLIFQVCWMLMLLQEELGLVHRDFHDSNILMSQRPQPSSRYHLKDHHGQRHHFILPEVQMTPVVWDMETSISFGPDCRHPANPNGEVPGLDVVPTSFNAAYDLHLFLMCLQQLPIPTEINDWILSLYPPHLVSEIPDISDQSSSLGSTSSSKSAPCDVPTKVGKQSAELDENDLRPLNAKEASTLLLKLKHFTPELEHNHVCQQHIDTILEELVPAVLLVMEQEQKQNQQEIKSEDPKSIATTCSSITQTSHKPAKRPKLKEHGENLTETSSQTSETYQEDDNLSLTPIAEVHDEADQEDDWSDDELKVENGELDPLVHYLPTDTYETWMQSTRPRPMPLQLVGSHISTEWLFGDRLRHKALEEHQDTLPTPLGLLMHSPFFHTLRTKSVTTKRKRRHTLDTPVFTYDIKNSSRVGS